MVGTAPGIISGAPGAGTLGSLNAGVWTETGNSPEGEVRTLLSGAELYVGGTFTVAGSINCGNFAVWNGLNYSTLQNPSGAGLNGTVYSLEQYQGQMVAAGFFNLAGSTSLVGLGTWDGSAWLPFAAGAPNAKVNDLYIDGADLYAVGAFTTVGGLPVDGVARSSGGTWFGYAPLPSEPTRVMMYNGDLYVSSFIGFTNGMGAWVSGYLKKWNGAGWDDILANDTVLAMEVFAGELWIATYNNGHMSYDGVNLTDQFLGLSKTDELQAHDGKLYLLRKSGIKTWDGVQLISEGPSVLVQPEQSFGIDIREVKALYFVDDQIYIANRGGYNGYSVWQWDTTTGIAEPLDLGTNGTVRAICPLGDSIYFGGTFTLAGISNTRAPTGLANPVVSAGIARWAPSMAAGVRVPTVTAGLSLSNGPNPFNPRTTVRFQLPAAVNNLEIGVYDIRGRLLRELWSGQHPAGSGQAQWDGKDSRGLDMASGIYFVGLKADAVRIQHKIVLVR